MKTTEFGTHRIALLFTAAILLSACSTQYADENSIAISHSARQAGAAALQAEKHCAQFGKKAVLVRKGPKQSTYLVETNVSEFDCVN